MRRLATSGALTLVLAGLVTGCGSDENAYCAALKEQQSVFSDDGTGVALLLHLDELGALADKAPDDLRDEWQTVLGALRALDDAIDQAGVAPGDFVDGKPPASVGAEDQRRIVEAASQVSEPDVVDAFSGIDQQAKDVCKTQLGL